MLHRPGSMRASCLRHLFLVLLDSRSAALDQNRQHDNKQQAGYHPDDHVRIHRQILSWNVLYALPDRFRIRGQIYSPSSAVLLSALAPAEL